MQRRFLVKSDSSKVLVTVNPDCHNALEDNLLLLEPATPDNSNDIQMETPLRAFSAKMVDIIEAVGTGDFKASPGMIDMMKKEKASSELARIERFARKQSA